MANVKKAVQEEVTEKEIPRAAYEGVLTIDVDAQVESAQEQEDTRWHQLLNAHRTRKVLTGQLQHHKLKEKMERNLFAGSFHCVKI